MFFFFSSRRRHTRYIGDWNSDVCSSDLLPSPLRSRSSSSPSRCTSTSGRFASNSLAVHPASPEADLRRRRAPIFEGARLPVSHVLHNGFATANGNDSHVLPIQSPAALDAGRCSIILRAGGGLGLRHLRLHSERRRGSRILGHAGIALQLRVRLHQPELVA